MDVELVQFSNLEPKNELNRLKEYVDRTRAKQRQSLKLPQWVAMEESTQPGCTEGGLCWTRSRCLRWKLSLIHPDVFICDVAQGPDGEGVG